PEATLKEMTAPVVTDETKPTLPLALMTGCANSSRTIAAGSETVRRSPSLAWRSLACTTIKLNSSRHEIKVASFRLSFTLLYLPSFYDTTHTGQRTYFSFRPSYAFHARIARESLESGVEAVVDDCGLSNA